MHACMHLIIIAIGHTPTTFTCTISEKDPLGIGPLGASFSGVTGRPSPIIASESIVEHCQCAVRASTPIHSIGRMGASE